MPTPQDLSDLIAQDYISAFTVPGLGEEDVGEVDIVDDTLLGKLQDLMPPGFVWTRDPDARLTKLLLGLSYEMFRVWQRARTLLEDEAIPTRTVELLPDWERIVGLDVGGVQGTLAERRAAVVELLRHRGGQSVQFFIDVCQGMGYVPTTITDPKDPFYVDDTVGTPIQGGPWHFAFQINTASKGQTLDDQLRGRIAARLHAAKVAIFNFT